MIKLKYNNKKTPYNGFMYDSKFEASVARDLDLRIRAKEILSWENQFRIIMIAYNMQGVSVMIKKHKVDFRLRELDGTYTLLEAKGVETPEYKEIRRWILALFLPINPNYRYQVISRKNGLVAYQGAPNTLKPAIKA